MLLDTCLHFLNEMNSPDESVFRNLQTTLSARKAQGGRWVSSASCSLSPGQPEWGLGSAPTSPLPSCPSRGERELWRRNTVEKPVPRQFGEWRWRGSRGRRELVSRPSVSFPSFPAPPDPAHRLEGHRDPDYRWGMGVMEREFN